MAIPQVSVLLPIYGHEPFLEETLDSLASQDFSDFETIVVVDDVSEDVQRTLDASPINITEVEGPNAGVGAARNAGLDVAAGEYVAMMDADDVAKPERFARQVETLDGHPEIGVLGSSYETIDADGCVKGQYVPPFCHEAIHWRLFTTGSALPNPTAMIRQSELAAAGLCYRTEMTVVEDYDLWTRLLPHTRFKNLKNPLVGYRIEGPSISRDRRTTMRKFGVSVAHRTIERDLPSVSLTEAEVREILDLLSGDRPVNVRRASRNYLEMFTAFEGVWTADNVCDRVRSQVAEKLAHGILQQPLGTDNLEILLRLLAFDPKYPAALASGFIRHRFPW